MEEPNKLLYVVILIAFALMVPGIMFLNRTTKELTYRVAQIEKRLTQIELDINGWSPVIDHYNAKAKMICE